MIIYKYLDEKGAIETIKRNAVLLKSPFDFNDPFDSIFYIDDNEVEKSYKLLMNYQLFKKGYEDLVLNKNVDSKPSMLGNVIKANIKIDAPSIKKTLRYTRKNYMSMCYKLGLKIQKKDDSDIKTKFSETMKIIMDALKYGVLVSCFGTSFDSILMWSHYANKHKGACIEFEVDDPDFREVKYSKDFPVFRLYDALEIILGHDFAGVEVDTNKPEYRFIVDPIFVKSDDWKYEGEVRCIYSNSYRDSKIFEIDDIDKKLLLKMPKIKKIYLGCNAKESFVKEIEKISSGIPVIKLRKKTGEYGLEICNEKVDNTIKLLKEN